MTRRGLFGLIAAALPASWMARLVPKPSIADAAWHAIGPITLVGPFPDTRWYRIPSTGYRVVSISVNGVEQSLLDPISIEEGDRISLLNGKVTVNAC